MKIGDAPIGEGGLFFIAEAGINHNGSVERGKEMVEVAADAGADAVKFQTFSAARLVTRKAETAAYQSEQLEEDLSQYELLRRYEFDASVHEELWDHCSREGIAFLSTPFDIESADLLSDLGVPAFKIGSGELTNRPLLEHVAEFGTPMIVSTGMGTMEEVRDAHRFIESANPDVDVVFLHCTSAYPTPVDDVNLRAMQAMADELPVPVGLSDHTTLVETPGFAVAAGAHIVEKHFTLDRSLPGPDHSASLEPDELASSVENAKNASRALGRAAKEPTAVEIENRSTIRKSLHAATALAAGETLTAEDVAIKRPADGLPPTRLGMTLGRTLRRGLDVDDPITDECLESE